MDTIFFLSSWGEVLLYARKTLAAQGLAILQNARYNKKRLNQLKVGVSYMSYSFSGIDHVQLAAPKGSEDEARKFFVDILGMVEIPKPANLAKRGGVWFQVGTHQLHIGIQDDFVPAKKAHPAFHVNNLEAFRERLVKRGVKVKEDEPLEGANRFYVDDPFGNRIEFLERINQ